MPRDKDLEVRSPLVVTQLSPLFSLSPQHPAIHLSVEVTSLTSVFQITSKRNTRAGWLSGNTHTALRGAAAPLTLSTPKQNQKVKNDEGVGVLAPPLPPPAQHSYAEV